MRCRLDGLTMTQATVRRRRSRARQHADLWMGMGPVDDLGLPARAGRRGARGSLLVEFGVGLPFLAPVAIVVGCAARPRPVGAAGNAHRLGRDVDRRPRQRGARLRRRPELRRFAAQRGRPGSRPASAWSWPGSSCSRQTPEEERAPRPEAATGRRVSSRPWPSSGAVLTRPPRRRRANHEAMAALVADLRRRQADGRRARRRAATSARSPAIASAASCRSASASTGCSTPGRRFLELSPLAADGLYDGDAPVGRDRHRDRPDRGDAVRRRRQRRDRQGRHVLPAHGEEAPARPGDRAREPAAVPLPRRQRRRLPAAPGRGLPGPRALRPDLLQPGPAVGRRRPPDRPRHGLAARPAGRTSRR